MQTYRTFVKTIFLSPLIFFLVDAQGEVAREE